jgi:hypothetical protein
MAFAGEHWAPTAAIAEPSERAARIAVHTCHPGDVVFTLSRNLGFGGHETPGQAARFGADREAVEALFHAYERYYPLCYFCVNTDAQ